jgi:EmrB/QacA subfamily drug resistance transporter
MNVRHRNTAIALAVASVTFMELLDATILNTALPAMARSLSVTAIDLKAAITTYLVALSIFIPISGWIADRFGTKTTMLTAIGLFTASSAACAMAGSLEALVVFRALQGIGGALMTPVARLVIVRLFERTELVRVAGLVAMPAVMGPVLGPLIGGYLTTNYSWPWVFLVNVPVGAVAMAAIALLARNDRSPSPSPLDVRGFLALGLGLSLVTVTLESLDGRGLAPATVTLLIATGLLCLAYGVCRCLVVSNPVFDLSLFCIGTFRVGLLQTMIGLLGCGGIPLLVAVLLQGQYGYSPLHAGEVLFFAALGSLLVKPCISPLVRRFGYRAILTVYPLSMSAALGLLAFSSVPDSFWLMAGLMFLFGACQSVFMNMVNAIPYLDVAQDRSSKATSLQSTVQQLSLSLGITFAALLLDRNLSAAQLTLGDRAQSPGVLAAFQAVFAVLAVVSLANALVGASLARTAPLASEAPAGNLAFH